MRVMGDQFCPGFDCMRGDPDIVQGNHFSAMVQRSLDFAENFRRFNGDIDDFYSVFGQEALQLLFVGGKLAAPVKTRKEFTEHYSYAGYIEIMNRETEPPGG